MKNVLKVENVTMQFGGVVGWLRSLSSTEGRAALATTCSC